MTTYKAHGFNVPFDQDEDYLKVMRDIHEGDRAFIIGNGKSLERMNLNPLWGEITFGCNDIRLMFPDFVPMYWVIEDWRFYDAYYEDIYENNITTKLVNGNIEEKMGKDIVDESTIRWVSIWHPTPQFSTDAIGGVNSGGTTIFSMLQLAWHMGCREFYLIGCDHDLPRLPWEDNEDSHFHYQYNECVSYEIGQYRDYRRMDMAFDVAREFIESHGGIIRNATPGGRLETFDRVDYDSLFD